jgi:hypothetical protein
MSRSFALRRDALRASSRDHGDTVGIALAIERAVRTSMAMMLLAGRFPRSWLPAGRTGSLGIGRPRRALLLTALIVVGCDHPTSSGADAVTAAVVYCGSISQGTSCAVPGDRCISGDCRALVQCTCDGLTYSCRTGAAASDGEACGAYPNTTQCSIEGHAACNVDPVSGGCSCDGGTWSCFSSCPRGCPRDQPAPGASCSLPGDTICPYEAPPYSGDRVTCTCANGAFDCR